MTGPSTYTTRRVTVPQLEALLFRELPVLDHGFLRVVDYMGDDSSIVQAARVSYGVGTKTVREDKALIKYLMRNRHTSPFEMCEIKLHVKLPIFVARQWIRHRMASVNEYSARYSILDKEFYFPAPENVATQSQDNRQGRADPIPPEMAQQVLRIMREDAHRNYEHYLEFLGGSDREEKDFGISRELARINLTLNTYTQWYWKSDLHNLLGFLQLRADPHAQLEIREYAKTIMDVVRIWVPSAYEAFEEYRYGSVTLSRTEVSILRDLLVGKGISKLRAELTKRDWEKLAKIFGLG
jgi:thymidylate synthase (FAD)